MDAQHYISTRQIKIKKTFYERRKEAGYSQQVIAELLGCTRSRISDIEDLQKTVCYTLGEMELLASLFGINPLDLLRQGGEETIATGEILTKKHTGAALLDMLTLLHKT